MADPDDVTGTPQDLVRARPIGPDSALAVLVLFFDAKRSGAWIARKDLKQLGENTELDALMRDPIACWKLSTKGKGNLINQAAHIVRSSHLLADSDLAVSLVDD